jgi:hypothetical protein
VVDGGVSGDVAGLRVVVRTSRVSPSRGLPAPLFVGVTLLNGLTSRLKGEEGGLGGRARALRVFRRHLSLPVVNHLKINIIQLVNR